MTSLRRLEARLNAWTSFRGVARATRSLAAAQTLRWVEHVADVERFVSNTGQLCARYGVQSLPPGRPRVVLAIGTDVGLCGPLNARVAAAAKPVWTDDAIIRIMVGRRLEPLLPELEASVLPAPSSFAAVQTLAAQIRTLLEPLPPRQSILHIVVAHGVEPDGTPVVRCLDRSDTVPQPGSQPRLGVELSSVDLARQTAASLHRYARIVQALTRGAASETEARWRTMNRAHDAADRRINEQERVLRSLRQELITQEMLEARSGRR